MNARATECSARTASTKTQSHSRLAPWGSTLVYIFLFAFWLILPLRQIQFLLWRKTQRNEETSVIKRIGLFSVTGNGDRRLLYASSNGPSAVRMDAAEVTATVALLFELSAHTGHKYLSKGARGHTDKVGDGVSVLTGFREDN